MTKATLITRNQGLILSGLTTLLAKHEVLETTTAKQHTDMLGKVGNIISKTHMALSLHLVGPLHHKHS